MTARSLCQTALLAGILLHSPQFAAIAQQTATKSQSSSQTIATLDRMTAAGRSQQEIAQYVFETHGCRSCHTVGHNGKLGFTEKGKQMAQGSEGCIALLTAMSVIAQVPEAKRSSQQRQKAARFEEAGCTFCHSVTAGRVGPTQVGSRLANLHLGCVDVQKLVASGAPRSR